MRTVPKYSGLMSGARADRADLFAALLDGDAVEGRDSVAARRAWKATWLLLADDAFVRRDRIEKEAPVLLRAEGGLIGLRRCSA